MSRKDTTTMNSIQTVTIQTVTITQTITTPGAEPKILLVSAADLKSCKAEIKRRMLRATAQGYAVEYTTRVDARGVQLSTGTTVTWTARYDDPKKAGNKTYAPTEAHVKRAEKMSSKAYLATINWD